MKALVVTRTGGYEVLEVQERPDPPPPGPGEIRVAVRAAGVNFAELMARNGIYPDAPKLPAVLGYEAAGVVESVGAEVDAYAVGDRVVAGSKFGAHAEMFVARVDDSMPLPERLSFEQGAAVAVNYATAWAAAVVMGGVRAGDTMLVHAAAGGVGIAATQVGVDAGATVIGTASAAKHDAVRAQGAAHVIDYRSADVVAEVLRITDGRGVDVALDALGPTSFRKDYRILRPGGRLVMYGISEIQTGEKRSLRRAVSGLARTPFATMPFWKSAAMLNENKGIYGLNLLSWWETEGNLRRLLEPVAERLESGVFTPVVAESFPFSRAADAYRFLQEARNIGKVVLIPD